MTAKFEDSDICKQDPDASTLLPPAKQLAEQSSLPQNHEAQHQDYSLEAQDHEQCALSKLDNGLVTTSEAAIIANADAVAAPLSADAQNTPDTVPSPEVVMAPSDHDKAVGIVEKMDPVHLPQSADMQATIEELKDPTKLPGDKYNCSLPCFIPCKNNSCESLVYRCDNRKYITLRKGTKALLQQWTNGLTPRWKLLYICSKLVLYFILWVMVTAKFSINASQGKHIVFDSISFVLSFLGFLVSIGYAMAFIIRNRKEVLITICDTGVYIVLRVYQYCCCKKKFGFMEYLKEKEDSNCEHKTAEKYVNEKESFKLPQNSFQELTALLENTSEVLLTVVDDIILTVVFLLSLYSFLEKQDFLVFFGSMDASHRLGFVILVLSALKIILFVHGLRVCSIAVNVRALDMKVERDSKVMEVELTNKFIRYFLSFQARLVFHVLATSVFQLYGIFALSWKIIQDTCSVVEAPSTLVGNGNNGGYMNYTSARPGAPFTCSSPSFANGFTIYNILYIAIVPTLLGYTSFFVCNTPWLVEYMQTITMWTYLQIEYITGVRARDDDKGRGWTKTSKMVKAVKMVENVNTVVRIKREESVMVVQKVNVVETVEMASAVIKDTYISPQMQLLKIFHSNALYNVTNEELQEAGARTEHIRETIQEDYEKDAETYGNNPVSRVAIKLGQVTLCMPAAIIGTLQLTLFIIHIAFMGCGASTCFSDNIHAVLSSVASDDVAAVLVPLTGLFLLTSFPGPWIGLFWLLVVLGIVAVVAAVVAFAAAVIVVIIILVLCVCLGSATNAVTPE